MANVPAGTTRGAVVIGIDRTKGLPALGAAASGAHDMERWLAPGYHVTALTDREGGSVGFTDVFNAVSAYAKCMTLEQLVVYFAGHGFYTANSEVWLLSGAPENPNEAINLRESAEFARSSGLKNVIFIPDTCRSVPQDLATSQIRGGSIFPNIPNAMQCDIDIFFATLPGDVAIEAKRADIAARQYTGIFTDALIAIHASAASDDVVPATIGGKPVHVFPNRRLKAKFPVFFRAQVAKARLNVRQMPSLRIESSEPVHLATAIVAEAIPAGPVEKNAVNPRPYAGDGISSTIEDAARVLIQMKAIPDPPERAVPGTDNTELALALEAQGQKQAEQGAHFETQSGALLSGSQILEAVAIGPFGIDQEQRPSGAALRFKNTPGDYGPLTTPFSAAIRFADGSGTIIAALPGYVASLLIRDGGLVNISYIPAEGTALWHDAQYSGDEAENRRAMAATAARHGVLALERADAKAFGDRIRIGKAVDPTLGLYAALAYASVGLRDDAKSVLTYMQQDLRANIYDAWLLAGGDSAQLSVARPLVPLCPMLSQSWDYLDPAGVQLPELLRTAARHPSLWTTFRPEVMEAILAAARKGELG